MDVTIKLLDELSTSTRKKRITVMLTGPVSIKRLYELAGVQEGKPTLPRELEGFMISYKGRLLNHEEFLNKEIFPGDEILLLPTMEGG